MSNTSARPNPSARGRDDEAGCGKASQAHDHRDSGVQADRREDGLKPKFTKRYAKLTEIAVDGIQQYIGEVEEGAFPDDDHTYGVDEAEYEKFATMIEKRKQV